MDPILADFESAARRIPFSAPRTPLVSNLTGAILEAGQIPDAAYWRDHIRAEVKFAQGIQSLASSGIDVFLEIGPSPVLLGIGMRCLPESQSDWLPSLRQGKDDWQVILESLGKVYVRGAHIDWDGFDRGYARHKVSLPNYPFERQRYWLEPSQQQGNGQQSQAPAGMVPTAREIPLAPSNNGKREHIVNDREGVRT